MRKIKESLPYRPLANIDDPKATDLSRRSMSGVYLLMLVVIVAAVYASRTPTTTPAVSHTVQSLPIENVTWKLEAENISTAQFKASYPSAALKSYHTQQGCEEAKNQAAPVLKNVTLICTPFIN